MPTVVRVALVVALVVVGFASVATAAGVDGSTLKLDEAGLTLRAPGGSWTQTRLPGGVGFECHVNRSEWVGVSLTTDASGSLDLDTADGALTALGQRGYMHFEATFNAKKRPQDLQSRRLAGLDGWYDACAISKLRQGGPLHADVVAEVHAWIGRRGPYVVCVICQSPARGDMRDEPDLYGPYDPTFYNNVAGSMRADGSWQPPADPPEPTVSGDVPTTPTGQPTPTPGGPTPDTGSGDDGSEGADDDGDDSSSRSSGGGNTMLIALIVAVLIGGGVAAVIVANQKKSAPARSSGRGRGGPRRGGASGGRGGSPGGGPRRGSRGAPPGRGRGPRRR